MAEKQLTNIKTLDSGELLASLSRDWESALVDLDSNFLDYRTDKTAKRKITLTFEFIPEKPFIGDVSVIGSVQEKFPAPEVFVARGKVDSGEGLLFVPPEQTPSSEGDLAS